MKLFLTNFQSKNLKPCDKKYFIARFFLCLKICSHYSQINNKKNMKDFLITVAAVVLGVIIAAQIQKMVPALKA